MPLPLRVPTFSFNFCFSPSANTLQISVKAAPQMMQTVMSFIGLFVARRGTVPQRICEETWMGG